MKLKTAFINDKLNEEEVLHKEFKSLLLEYFKTVNVNLKYIPEFTSLLDEVKLKEKDMYSQLALELAVRI